MSDTTIAAAVAPFLAAINNLPEEAVVMPPEVVLALTIGSPLQLLPARWERTLQEAPERIGDYARAKMSNPESALPVIPAFGNPKTGATQQYRFAASASIHFADAYLFTQGHLENGWTVAHYQIEDDLLERAGGERVYSYFYWLGCILMTADLAAQNPEKVLKHTLGPVDNLPQWYERVAEAGLEIHEEVLLP